MITKYCVSKYGGKPERLEFERETEKCLFDKRGRKTLKVSSWETYYDTLEQAQSVIDAHEARQASYDVENRIRKAAPQLLEALEKAQQDINWMLNNRQFLNGHVFDYIDSAIAAAKGE